nr:transporter substrate-binding domain-containing protein [Bacteroidota bacterium]
MTIPSSHITICHHILLALLILVLISCSGTHEPKSKTESKEKAALNPIKVDFKKIKENGKLTALTSYNSTSYFIYRGEVMGYEYELLKRMCDYMDLELEIKVVGDKDQVIDMLLKGEGDIISLGLTVTEERQQSVKFTEYHTKTHQVLVQRKPSNWRNMKVHEIEKVLIRDAIDLIGKKVYVRKNSSYHKRLQNLSDEIGGDIEIVEVSGNMETEEIIQMVADGKIDYTVADQNIAEINATYLTILDIETPVSFNQRIAWAVRPNSPELLKVVNEWISDIKKSTDYYVIYNKYFKNKRAFKKRVKSEYFSLKSGKISEYDDLIRQYSDSIDWDWRILASQVYQESLFDPKAQSWAGAKGLMQIMPATARRFNINPSTLANPENSMIAGTRYIMVLNKKWGIIPDSVERIKFVLASYNVGENHISDARKLAEKYGADPNRWSGQVEDYILLKSNPKYYNDPLVKYGYARGTEPYKYVREILTRHDKYKTVIPE